MRLLNIERADAVAFVVIDNALHIVARGLVVLRCAHVFEKVVDFDVGYQDIFEPHILANVALCEFGAAMQQWLLRVTVAGGKRAAETQFGIAVIVFHIAHRTSKHIAVGESLTIDVTIIVEHHGACLVAHKDVAVVFLCHCHRAQVACGEIGQGARLSHSLVGIHGE